MPPWPARTRRPARSPTRSSTRRCRATRGSASGAASQSQREQAGVDPAAGDTAARLAAGNAAYEERFGRVFLIRAAGRDAEAILAELDRRLGNDDATERAETVDNLRQIALLRLGGAALMATLSTHVLDTAAGRPAAGVAVRLESRDGDVLDRSVTDDDGRVGSLGGELGLGGYVLRFDTGAYVNGFFPEVVIVFTVADDRHHHVPLLLSPYGYSTYRGS